MSATVADLNPKTLENAKRQFVELYGSALVMNTYLKIALLLVCLLAVGLLALNFRTQTKYATVKPLVIRIDDVGRAEAVSIDRERPVIFHCHVGSRSRMAAQAFRQAGFEAYSMAGGLESWEHEGRPLQTGA